MASVLKNIKIQDILKNEFFKEESIRKIPTLYRENEICFLYEVDFSNILKNNLIFNYTRLNKINLGILKLMGLSTCYDANISITNKIIIDFEQRELEARYYNFDYKENKKLIDNFYKELNKSEKLKKLGCKEFNTNHIRFLIHKKYNSKEFIKLTHQISCEIENKEKIKENINEIKNEINKIIKKYSKKYFELLKEEILKKINNLNEIIEGKRPIMSFSIKCKKLLSFSKLEEETKCIKYEIYLENFEELGYKKLNEKEQNKFIKFKLKRKTSEKFLKKLENNKDIKTEIEKLENAFEDCLNKAIKISNYKTGNIDLNQEDYILISGTLTGIPGLIHYYCKKLN
jgi:hypothetical protein